jgi:glycosyltransferase involved in cell wall biosynthesis
MRVYYFTGGAAGMYCGSCLRDNALAAELMRQGHRVLLLPVYTPTRTDEENVSEERVFFSGLSVYARQMWPWLRRAPAWLTRWMDSPRVIAALTRLSISNNPRQLGALTVSMLEGEEGPQAEEFRKLVEWLKTQPRPDVVSIPYTLLIRMAAPLKQALDCAAVCTLQGEDLFLEQLPEPWRSRALERIRAHVGDVDAFIATCDYYADFMAEYLKIPRAKIHTVPLGLRLEGYERSERPPDAPFTIGYFARIAPEKGLHHLAEAYRIARQELALPAARLEAAGYMGAEHRKYLDGITGKLRAWGLGAEFRYHGELSREEKIRFLQGLDLFSVPTEYAEPKGLFLLEAMACGVPVVQPRHGAFPEILEKARGGELVEPGNPRQLAEALVRLFREPERRRALGRAGYEGVRKHFTIEQEAARALEVYAQQARATTRSEARA